MIRDEGVTGHRWNSRFDPTASLSKDIRAQRGRHSMDTCQSLATHTGKKSSVQPRGVKYVAM